MPVFGARMVCETANVKHIEKVKKDMMERETKLADWEKEKAERIGRLRERSNSLAAAIQARPDFMEKLGLSISPPKTNPMPERHPHGRHNRSGSIHTSAPSTLWKGNFRHHNPHSPKSPMERPVFTFDPIEGEVSNFPRQFVRSPMSQPASATGSRGPSGTSTPCAPTSPLSQRRSSAFTPAKTAPTTPCSPKKSAF